LVSPHERFSMTVASIRNLCKTFAVRGRTGTRQLRAVDDVSFDVTEGETLGVVGESGSGKSTTGRMLVGLIPATSGSITLFGRSITGPEGAAGLAAVRPLLQMVFQDPNGALDPRMTAGSSIAEPLAVAGTLSRRARADRVAELLDIVGLPASAAERHPHEFSGGQRQRICIARALALNPSFIVCDEAVSALDVSMQAQIVNLLLDLQERMGLSYLFIAHDLAVVRSISTRVAVMYAGRLVEIAPRRALYDTPRHPYTQALLDAVPRPVPGAERSARIGGEVPSLLDPPSGCAFHTRCPMAFERCRVEVPKLRAAGDTLCACHLYEGA
jgi:oligopeptide/dipeptide ABC transporter ATP-binding protein